MNIEARTDEKTAEWCEMNFGSRNDGAEFVLDVFPGLYRETLRELRGRFTEGELSLILDVMNGTMITPQLAGHSLAANAEDGMRLDRLDVKWETEPTAFMAKLGGLGMFERVCMEIWARAFWVSGAWERENGLEDYIESLLGDGRLR